MQAYPPPTHVNHLNARCKDARMQGYLNHLNARCKDARMQDYRLQSPPVKTETIIWKCWK